MCAIVDCFMPPCVDAVRNPDQCCPVCPNGRCVCVVGGGGGGGGGGAGGEGGGGQRPLYCRLACGSGFARVRAYACVRARAFVYVVCGGGACGVYV